MAFIATKAFSVGTGGVMTSYAVGDVVQPAHANIAPLFCAEQGRPARTKTEKKEETEPERDEAERPARRAPKRRKG